ncbi:MAG: hypothetical protein ABI627_29005 [Polyangiaceae bacterium]
MKILKFSALASVLFLGCAADPGTRPHDMSAASHEAEAKQEDTASAAHGTQFDPAAESTEQHASRGGSWTSTTNPTKEHDAEAQHHHELAVEHRAASTALTQAETRACVDVSEADRDSSPFSHREDITSVTPLEEKVVTGKNSREKLVGATTVFRATPGMTAEWLQRVVDCHVARAASVGHAMPEMDYCPLALNNIESAKVGSAGDGFSITVRSEDPATAEAILKRSQGLSSAKSASAAEARQASK